MAQAPPTVRIFREPGDAEKKAWGLEQPFSEDNVTACFQKDAQAPTTQIFNAVRKNLQAYYCRVEDEADSGGLFTMPLHQRWGRGVIALNRKATPGGGGRVAERKQLNEHNCSSALWPRKATKSVIETRISSRLGSPLWLASTKVWLSGKSAVPRCTTKLAMPK